MVLAAFVAAFALMTTNAMAATATYSGTGWLIADNVGDKYLDIGTWYIEFYDTYTKDRVSKYAALTAAEITKYTGVTVKVTTIVGPSFKDQNCPGHTSTGGHRIVIKLDSATSRSYSWMCGYSNHSDSSKVMLSQSNWTNVTRAGSHESYRRNVVSHELGHSVGLGHAPMCSLTGTDPLMCGDYWGGYSYYADAQKYTAYDANGLRQLVKNRSYF